jgi:hypothetical protein
LQLEQFFHLEEIPVPEREMPEFIRRPQSRWDVSNRTKPAGDEPEEQPKERQLPELALNLGAMIVQLAIDDYQGADEREHGSAALFLFPRTKAYADHFMWAIGQTEADPTATRWRLEALRPVWDANRKRER